jgi:hypothetical protein
MFCLRTQGLVFGFDVLSLKFDVDWRKEGTDGWNFKHQTSNIKFFPIFATLFLFYAQDRFTCGFVGIGLGTWSAGLQTHLTINPH